MGEKKAVAFKMVKKHIRCDHSFFFRSFLSGIFIRLKEFSDGTSLSDYYC